MNRKERRNREKKEKQLSDKKVEAIRWFNSLSYEKAMLVDSYAKMIAEKHNKYFVGALDRAYTATLVDQFEELEWYEIEKIIDVFDRFVEDDVKKMQKLSGNYGGDLDMATKKINEQEAKVRDRAVELIEKSDKQKENIETLLIEFPTLSKSMLTNAYKKTKTMLREAKEMKDSINKALDIQKVVNTLGDPDVETDNAIEYIFGKEEIGPEEALKEAVVTKDDEVKVETIEVPKMEVPAEAPEVDFEILKEVRIVDLKGKFGKYHVEKNVVEVTDLDLAFCNEDEVADWAEEERSAIWNQIEELQNKMNSITDREAETIKVIKKFM